MAKFLERYQAGERVEVWDDLVALGEGVRHKLYHDDAIAVANETMRRARHNVELLIRRLVEIGYRFVPPADDYQLPHVPPDASANLRTLHERVAAFYPDRTAEVD